ncbi:hypothetical protein [Bailinhaonella thermotolerans]|uniref:Uncharacterized protein n=1 Tax=Bailinhaonella thermotolerans TaxID=1070861 RepID=A0A3A4A7U9_9ACTN|nr:hypothetical protein [Bailinhaonella thermotolerans]RJL21076.1 hypothetical protein D5H75_38335 [Bailinhaonella thermotolerans]
MTRLDFTTRTLRTPRGTWTIVQQAPTPDGSVEVLLRRTPADGGEPIYTAYRATPSGWRQLRGSWYRLEVASEAAPHAAPDNHVCHPPLVALLNLARPVPTTRPARRRRRASAALI